MGLAWVWLSPLLMLLVYTFVFSEIFRLKWPGTESLGSLGYALHIFVGMIVFQFFSEMLGKSPGLIQQNPNYVKKVVFPLAALPLVSTLSSATMLLTMSVILLIFTGLLQTATLSWLWLPLILVPLFLFVLGLSYLFAGLGVYLPDLKQVSLMLSSFLMFLSPVFYPVSAVPPAWQKVFMINPLAQFMEAIRSTVVLGEHLSLITLIVLWASGLLSLMVGFSAFRAIKKGFADVL